MTREGKLNAVEQRQVRYLRLVKKLLSASGAEVAICVWCRSCYLRLVKKLLSASGAEVAICVWCRSCYLRLVKKLLSVSGAEVDHTPRKHTISRESCK